MSLGWLIALAIIVIILVVGLFSVISDPKEIDDEETTRVQKEIERKNKKHWWRS